MSKGIEVAFTPEQSLSQAAICLPLPWRGKH